MRMFPLHIVTKDRYFCPKRWRQPWVNHPSSQITAATQKMSALWPAVAICCRAPGDAAFA
jgi:hypothetical protein